MLLSQKDVSHDDLEHVRIEKLSKSNPIQTPVDTDVRVDKPPPRTCCCSERSSIECQGSLFGFWLAGSNDDMLVVGGNDGSAFKLDGGLHVVTSRRSLIDSRDAFSLPQQSVPKCAVSIETCSTEQLYMKHALHNVVPAVTGRAETQHAWYMIEQWIWITCTIVICHYITLTNFACRLS